MIRTTIVRHRYGPNFKVEFFESQPINGVQSRVLYVEEDEGGRTEERD